MQHYDFVYLAILRFVNASLVILYSTMRSTSLLDFFTARSGNEITSPLRTLGCSLKAADAFGTNFELNKTLSTSLHDVYWDFLEESTCKGISGSTSGVLKVTKLFRIVFYAWLPMSFHIGLLNSANSKFGAGQYGVERRSRARGQSYPLSLLGKLPF